MESKAGGGGGVGGSPHSFSQSQTITQATGGQSVRAVEQKLSKKQKPTNTDK